MVRPDSSGGLPSPPTAAGGGSLDETRPNGERFFEEYPGVRLRQFTTVGDHFRRQSRSEFTRAIGRFGSKSRPDAGRKEVTPGVDDGEGEHEREEDTTYHHELSSFLVKTLRLGQGRVGETGLLPISVLSMMRFGVST